MIKWIRSESGFSLLEVLIGGIFLFVFLVALAGIARLGWTAWNCVNGEYIWFHKGHLAMRLVEEDLRKVPSRASPDLRRVLEELTEHHLFLGGPEECAAWAQHPAPPQESRVWCWFRYRKVGPVLERERVWWRTSGEERAEPVGKLLFDVSMFQVEYQNAQGKWSAEWVGKEFAVPRVVSVRLERRRVRPGSVAEQTQVVTARIFYHE